MVVARPRESITVLLRTRLERGTAKREETTEAQDEREGGKGSAEKE